MRTVKHFIVKHRRPVMVAAFSFAATAATIAPSFAYVHNG